MDNEKNWPERNSALKSPWLRGLVLLMTIFFSVNIYMVWTAFNSKPNLVTPDYYKRGQSFTERTKIRKKTKELLDWKVSLTHPDIIMGILCQIKLSVTVKGDSISPEKVTLFAYRPSDAEKDFQTDMNITPDGDYTASITFTEQGYWDLVIVMVHEDLETDHAQRIFVKSH